jgi:hypothetical protein
MTARKRIRRAKKSLWQWCRNNRHRPLKDQHRILCHKLRGHFQYYAIRGNSWSLETIFRHAKKAWRYWLSRRSQKSYIPWEKFERLLRTYTYPLPRPRILHGI